MKKINISLNKILIIILVILIAILSIIAIIKLTEEERIHANMLKTYDNITYDDKVNAYLFYGEECPHCEHLLKYLDTLTNYEYNLYKFEVWHDKSNSKLKKIVIDKLSSLNYLKPDISIDNYYGSVPLLIIGNNVFLGYSSKYDIDIENSLSTNTNFDIMKILDLH